jgi:hypothetical protein
MMLQRGKYMDDSTSSGLVAGTSSLLDSVELSDYYGPPSGLDDAIAELLIALAEAASNNWSSFLGCLTEQRRKVLGRYTLRAPMLALRTKTPRHLYAGLLAHCLIEREVLDWRDDMVSFAPYVHVAHVLDVDVTALFDKAAAHAVPELATVMQTFGRRTDITLEAFGWRQVGTPDGPTFETVNWHNSPSGAVVGERSWDTVNQAQVQKLMDWINSQPHGRKGSPS